MQNKPLIEAVFEIRWVFPPSPNNPFSRDPFFYVHVGKLLPLLIEQFPEVKSLLPDGVPLPDEVLQKMYHYVLFSANGHLPLVQFGPGVLTVNIGETYEWNIFQEKLRFVLEQLYKSHPTPQSFSPKRLLLKYLNFFECSYKNNRVIDYIKDKLKLGILLPDDLFATDLISNDLHSFGFFWQYPCFDGKKKCIGNMTFSINAGEKDRKQGFFMEIGVQTQNDLNPILSPNNVPDISNWVVLAHDVIERCFFTIIKEIEEELDK
ncbi:MAG: TIGR04255 family protein [Planctomycetaceae bacterium]|nr:TIGR04255 family protein [Planctomycetaceae bacterium]